MRRLGIAAFAAGGNRVGTNPRAELDHRDKAVPVIAEDMLGRLRNMHLKGRKRAVFSLREGHWNARTVVAELRGDRRRDALEAIDFAPRHLPAAEVALKLGDCV